MVLLLVLLGVRGASDWSNSFAYLWYGLGGAAIIFALVAIGTAVFKRDARPRERMLGIALSGTTLVLAALLVWTIVSVLSHVS
jgi:hypothetical protein